MAEAASPPGIFHLRGRNVSLWLNFSLRIFQKTGLLKLLLYPERILRASHEHTPAYASYKVLCNA